MHSVVIITNTGYNDIYLGVLKYQIKHQIQDVDIFEFVTSIQNSIQESAAYLLLNEHHFNTNAIFYIENNIAQQINAQKILMIHYNNKWIVTADNGLVGLIEKDKIQNIYCWKETITTSFYAKNEMLNALKFLIKNSFSISKHLPTTSLDECKKIHWTSIIERDIGNDKKQIVVPILYIDKYQNIILNYKLSDYLKYSQEYDIQIRLPFHQIQKIHQNYNAVENNDVVALFNDAGYLEIAVNGGYLANLVAHKDIYSGDTHHILLELKKKNI